MNRIKKDVRAAIRLDHETYDKLKGIATEGNISQLIRLIVKDWLREGKIEKLESD